MNTTHLDGHLYLAGTHVGDVAIRGWHGSWGFGDFAPRASFERFAPLFNEWSRLMHADTGRLSRDNAARLRAIECRMYAIPAKLWVVPARQWRSIAILNIDRDMIEWKEGWSEGQADLTPAPGAVAQPA